MTEPTPFPGFERRVVLIGEEIKGLLDSQPADVVGAVLTERLACWIASHRVLGDDSATYELRKQTLNFVYSNVIARMYPEKTDGI